ncbi:hypothetical protein FNV43_RR26987 [Rhamnella rubrinervis]|uniref:Strictosidine synthase conserved region domain-containing protein n=1 Tax=Rhamnella rubrinervis TaxID=2594499 RepID=A0A8K0DNL0_9ROSA|nr:hypothetical protein FNV43_RR26987 [Rhamnella rubrinervis]
MKFSIGPSIWVIFSILFLFVASSFIVCNIENYSEIELPKVTGPECIAFDCHGNGPYVSVSDGRILKWQGQKFGWTEFAITSSKRQVLMQRNLCDGTSNPNLEPICGRPLGLKFNPTDCNMYIADAYFGLLMVGQNGGVAKQLATSAEGVPFNFTNALDIDSQTGMIYFTDSSTRFQRREWLLSILSGDKTGRLMQYDPNTKKVSVLLKGLAFANGVLDGKGGATFNSISDVEEHNGSLWLGSAVKPYVGLIKI